MGGRGSAGGNAKASAVSKATANKSTADERNARELARVERENRASGVEAIQELKKGESYSIQWSKNETREGTYIGGRIINGIAVQEFRGTNGKIMRIDNEDVKKSVRKIKKKKKEN